jgi:hypothetical protein
MNPLRQLDWAVLCFAWLGCYLIPWFVVGLLVQAVWGSEGAAVALLSSSYAVLYLVGMPLAAGYFTARFSKNRPRLHVLLVATFAAAAFAFISGGSLTVRAVVFVASLLFASFGAFFAFRRGVRHEA